MTHIRYKEPALETKFCGCFFIYFEVEKTS
jgi:hypothetical protein